MMLFRAPVMRFGGQYGVLESEIAAEGEEPSPLANDPANLVSLGLMSSAGRVGASYLWIWLTEPTVGTIQANDKGALRIEGLPDGTHVFSYRGLVMPSEGSPFAYTRTITVNVANGVPSYTLTPTGLTVPVTAGTAAWIYSAPGGGAYVLDPVGQSIQISAHPATWTYVPPDDDDYIFTPAGLVVGLETGIAQWEYTGPVIELSGEPVTLAQARLHLRLDVEVGESHPDDALILQLIAAARQFAEEYTGCAFTSAERTLMLDSLMPRVPLPYGPVGEIVSVRYLDQGGVLQTLPANQYRLHAHPDVPMLLVTGSNLPYVPDGPGAVLVTYRGAYGSSIPVPPMAVAAIKLIIGHLHTNREDVVAGVSVAELPQGAKALLWPLRRNLGA